MLKKLSVIAFFIFLSVAGVSGDTTMLSSSQVAMVVLRDNNCVSCHARLSTPLRLTSHYAEWHMSMHKESAIGCEKCHGGDPKISDEKKAHAGVVSPNDVKSRLHPQNLPETCNACHQGVVSSFNLDSVRRKADDAFEMGTKVKDSLRSKLYPQQ